MAGKYKRLELADRKKLEAAYLDGERAADIAEMIGVHLSAVYRELRRGYTGSDDKNGRPAYSADVAQKVVTENMSRRGRHFTR